MTHANKHNKPQRSTGADAQVLKDGLGPGTGVSLKELGELQVRLGNGGARGSGAAHGAVQCEVLTRPLSGLNLTAAR